MQSTAATPPLATLSSTTTTVTAAAAATTTVTAAAAATTTTTTATATAANLYANTHFNETYIHGSNFDNTYKRLYSALNGETAATLQKYGFAVIDNVLGATEAHALRQEICWMFKEKMLFSNHTAFVEHHSSGHKPNISSLISKPNVYEAEILPPLYSVVPRLTSLATKAIHLLDRHTSHLFPHSTLR